MQDADKLAFSCSILRKTWQQTTKWLATRKKEDGLCEISYTKWWTSKNKLHLKLERSTTRYRLYVHTYIYTRAYEHAACTFVLNWRTGRCFQTTQELNATQKSFCEHTDNSERIAQNAETDFGLTYELHCVVWQSTTYKENVTIKSSENFLYHRVTYKLWQDDCK